MIPRERITLKILIVVACIIKVHSIKTNDWTPLTNSCPTCTVQEPLENNTPIQKRSSSRSLHLTETERHADNYFPINEKVRIKKSQHQYLQQLEPAKPTLQTVQLNQGEIAPQYINQQLYQLRFPEPQQQILFQPQHPLVFPPQTQQQKATFSQNLQPPPQQQYIPERFITKSENLTKNFYEELNPGIQTINQAFSGQLNNYQPIKPVHITSTSKPDEKETVQLVYVPIESLNDRRNQILKPQQPQPQEAVLHVQPKGSQHHLQQSIQNDFAKQALEAFKLQLQFQQGQTPVPVLPTIITTTPPTTTTTTTKPLNRKRKPHQPPLAVYMGATKGVSVDDVLNILKNAETIAVQDTVGPHSPQVFIGPNTLQPPDGYTKFDLPYLSSLENNRVERKIDQLPFFVAPLSYKAPSGYSKIALPAPHVGSVVVSQKEELHEKVPQQQLYLQADNGLDGHPHAYQKRERQPQRNLHRFSTSSIRPTTIKIVTPRPDPLSHTINQYELEQINSQFVPQSVDYEQSFLAEVNPPQDHVRHRPQQQIQFTPDFRLQQPVEEQEIRPLQQQHVEQQQIRPLQQQPVQQQQIRPLQPQQEQQQIRPLQQQRQEFRFQQQQPQEQQQINPFQQQDHRLRPQHQHSGQSEQEQQQQERFESQQGRLQERPQQHFEKQTRPTYQPPQQLQQPTFNHHVRFGQQYETELQPQPKVQQQQPVVQGEKQQEEQSVKSVEYVQQQRLRDNLNRQQQQQIQNVEQSISPYQFISSTPANVRATPQIQYVNGFENSSPKPTIFLPQQQQQQQPVTGRPVFQDYNRYSILEGFGDNQRFPSTTPTPHVAQTVQPTVIPQNEFIEQSQSTPVPENQQTEDPAHINSAYLQVQPLNKFVPSIQENSKPISSSEQFQPINYQRGRTTTDSAEKFDNGVTIQPQRSRITTSTSTTTTTEDPVEISITKQPLQHVRTYTEFVPTEPTYRLPDHLVISPQIPGLVNDLQDQALRPLLIASSIAPTTQAVNNFEPIETTIIPEEPPITTTIAPTTRTTRRQRGRQRARTTTNYTTRRSVQRTRRPVSRTRYQSEGPEYSTSNYNDYSSETPRVRQKFRTRGRTSSTELPTTPLQEMFQYAQQPQSYMQFEQPMLKQQEDDRILKEYHPVYSAPEGITTTETIRRPIVSNNPKLNVDVVITHPVSEPDKKEIVLVSKPDSNPRYVIFNPQLQQATQQPEISTKKAQARIRSRGRTKSRLTTTTTTTEEPVVTTTIEKEETESPDFYGFFRPPQFVKPKSQTQQPITTKLYSSTYVSSTASPYHGFNDQSIDPNTIQLYPDNSALESSTPVNFIGELRPKYPSSTPNDIAAEETPTELLTEATTTEKRYIVRTNPTRGTSRPRIRGRVTLASRRPHNNDLSSPSTQASTTHRFRTRGKSHFKPPSHAEKEKDTSADVDVEGGNYPPGYLKAQEHLTERPKFQISVAPMYEEEELDDQVPYSSINHPRVVEKNQNSIQVDDKPYSSMIRRESTTTADMNDENDYFEVTTSSSENPTIGTQKRKGYWKLVKQRPIDNFEAAESQFVGSVLNSFHAGSVKKDLFDYSNEDMGKDVTTPIMPEEILETTQKPIEETSTKGSYFFDSLYKMFGMKDVHGDKYLKKDPIFGSGNEKIKELTTQKSEEFETTTLTPAESTTGNPVVNSTEKSVEKNQILKNLKENEFYDPFIGIVKTSTSTEISHETEICYRGKCIKSKSAKKSSL